MIKRRNGALLALALVSGGVLFAATASSANTTARPSWCGPKKISLGLTDGFGGNSWRLVTTASARDEAKKCASVTSLTYADGQGNTQKACAMISSAARAPSRTAAARGVRTPRIRYTSALSNFILLHEAQERLRSSSFNAWL